MKEVLNVEQAELMGVELSILCDSQSEWSQETFGLDSDRGPIGALKHLEKEAVECQNNPSDKSEFADCFLLLVDASRRAGIGISELIEAAADKHEVNKKRIWPKPIDDMPVEHIKTELDNAIT